jgi:hypothetical protein
MEEAPPREAAVRDMAIIFNNDKGSMKMVEHQVTYSPERKNNGHTMTSCCHKILTGNSNNLLTLLAADPLSSHPK